MSLQHMVWSGAGLGPSTDIEDYAQESGRVCCNGQRPKAILIADKNRYISEQMKSYVANAQNAESANLQAIPERRSCT